MAEGLIVDSSEFVNDLMYLAESAERLMGTERASSYLIKERA